MTHKKFFSIIFFLEKVKKTKKKTPIKHFVLHNFKMTMLNMLNTLRVSTFQCMVYLLNIFGPGY